MRIAVMQPYFMPYAGYFRLLFASDLFVFYDCVQFPRRGWVHRNRLTRQDGTLEWLTLPLARSARDTTRIIDLRFAPDAQATWKSRLSAFPALARPTPLATQVEQLAATPCDTIIAGIEQVCAMLDIPCNTARSSTLQLPDALKGQERILAICAHYGAKAYLNAPGGRLLYDEAAFAQHGITLEFLPDYVGNPVSILERLQLEPAMSVMRDIVCSQ